MLLRSVAPGRMAATPHTPFGFCSTGGGGGGRLQPVLMRHPTQISVKNWGGGLGWRLWGGGSAGGGGGPTRNPLLPHAYLQGGCVFGAGSGKLLVAVVKQGLQMGRCVHSGCGDLHSFAANDICLAPRLANLALKTSMV